MIYTVTKTLVLPPSSFFILFLLGLLIRKWRRTAGRVFLWGLLTVVYLSTTPFVAGELMAPLQPYPAVDLQHPDADIGAVVVLGAGIYFGAPEYTLAGAGDAPGITADGLTLQRLQYAAFLARRTGTPILVTGGSSGAAPQYTVADVMKTTLQRDFGVESRWIERASQSTLSNARLSATLLRDAGIRRFYLVTHAWHMPRAMASFEGLGVEPVPAPTRFISRSTLFWRDFIPSAGAFHTTYFAMHEWLGLSWYWLRRQGHLGPD
ncbi:YdcF family protein [Pelagibius marinus]|uniref:YdcF family protein n=1 Tax=Pelagibius marinus TaxID=2762760 RepID=UPI001872DF6C|nr:YdcF family protein [Pelagibius marinus]